MYLHDYLILIWVATAFCFSLGVAEVWLVTFDRYGFYPSLLVGAGMVVFLIYFMALIMHVKYKHRDKM